ncbi:PHB depolymerase family esterase [Pseudoduganella flava]|nr:PHB depolymerase family esterase [Pseudoduganella flava]
MMARLRAATEQLMKGGPLAATAAIQQALAGGAAPATTPDDALDGTDAGTAHATLKDLNAPPTYAQARKRAASARPQAQAAPDTGPSAQPDIGGWLKKAGIKLPEGLATGDLAGAQPDMSEWLKKAGINLPESLATGDLPGVRKRPPPPPLPEGAQFLSASYTCTAGTRGYKLYIPSTYRGQPMPLIVMLHGCTQDPDDFAAGTRMNQVAEETGCLVAWPAQSQQANSSRCWNWFSAADQQHGRGEPAIIAGIARQVMAEYAVDPAQVSIAGLSAGGAMAVVVGALYPDVFKAVGVHSGLPFGAARDLPSALQAMKQGAPGGDKRGGPPLIVFHGDKDGTVHPKNGAAILQDGLHRHGTDSEVVRGKATGGRRYTRTVYQGGDGTPRAEHWELHGGGHAWAGGSASGSYTDPTGPDASREMVRFFAAVTAKRQP